MARRYMGRLRPPPAPRSRRAAEQLDELASFSRLNLQLDMLAGVGLNEHSNDFLAGVGFAARY